MRKATQNIDYTNRDYEAYREMMITSLKEKMPEYTDTSQTDAGIVILECLANGLDICSLYADIIANDVLLPTTQDRQMACILARNLGYTPYNQTASITPQVFVLNSIKDKDTIIGKGTVVSTKVSSGMTAITFETVEDLIIPAGNLGNEKDEAGNYLYTVNIQHGTSVKGDVVGSSSGAPYQSFKLNFPLVLVDSLELYVDEGEGKRLWSQVDSLLDSTIDGNSRVYTVTVDDLDRCHVEFGNGVRGKIPKVFSNGITANYRVGGGSSGNVQANTVTELKTRIASVDSTFNPTATTTLGHDKETVEEIRVNAPASFRTRDRAVTLQDYSDLIRINNKGSLYAILNSKAIRDELVGTKANIYYQMRDGYEMTEELLKDIHEFFRTRIMIGTSLELFEYTPYVIDLEANLIVDKDYSREEVMAQVESYVKNAYFYYGNFTFEDEFLKTQLESEVLDMFKGVRSFRITSPTEDLISPSESYEIITLGSLTFNNVTGGK